ncbi:MAG: hypothetical protein EBU32_06545, partial [Opitutaceae bacterium]|nr:hypothetical protein [Opitutaceae bacterium]
PQDCATNAPAMVEYPHGIGEPAIWVRDPDGNGVELYWDRPEANWPRQPDGTLAMFTHALDLEALLHVR